MRFHLYILHLGAASTEIVFFSLLRAFLVMVGSLGLRDFLAGAPIFVMLRDNELIKFHMLRGAFVVVASFLEQLRC